MPPPKHQTTKYHLTARMELPTQRIILIRQPDTQSHTRIRADDFKEDVENGKGQRISIDGAGFDPDDDYRAEDDKPEIVGELLGELCAEDSKKLAYENMYVLIEKGSR
jgi:hypothetical protein